MSEPKNYTPGPQAPPFEEVKVGDQIPSREHGPLTIIDTVRWAGFQENWAQLHFDRQYVKEQAGIRTFIASGGYREALLIRLLTDWAGPKGQLRKLTLRHMYPTFEGDRIRYSGHVVEKSAEPSDPWVACELVGVNQEGQQILQARCVLLLAATKHEG
jgi:acyl dehydratase